MSHVPCVEHITEICSVLAFNQAHCRCSIEHAGERKVQTVSWIRMHQRFHWTSWHEWDMNLSQTDNMSQLCNCLCHTPLNKNCTNTRCSQKENNINIDLLWRCTQVAQLLLSFLTSNWQLGVLEEACHWAQRTTSKKPSCELQFNDTNATTSTLDELFGFGETFFQPVLTLLLLSCSRSQSWLVCVTGFVNINPHNSLFWCQSLPCFIAFSVRDFHWSMTIPRRQDSVQTVPYNSSAHDQYVSWTKEKSA